MILSHKPEVFVLNPSVNRLNSSFNIFNAVCTLVECLFYHPWLAGSPRVRQIVGSSHGRVKPKTITFVFVVSPLSMKHWEEITKTGWLGIRVMCPSKSTCLPAYCWFDKIGLVQSSTSLSSNVTCSRHNIAEMLPIWR